MSYPSDWAMQDQDEIERLRLPEVFALARAMRVIGIAVMMRQVLR